MWPESITEIAPEGEGGTVVWEWHAWDHLVQNVDASLPHFGEPADHPHRLDVNYANVGGGGGPGSANSGDWMHANAVNYNPTLDQRDRARRFNEIWIIDHSTTTEEAADPSATSCTATAIRKPTVAEMRRSGVWTARCEVDSRWTSPRRRAGDLQQRAGRPGCDCSTIDVWNPPCSKTAATRWRVMHRLARNMVVDVPSTPTRIFQLQHQWGSTPTQWQFLDLSRRRRPAL